MNLVPMPPYPWFENAWSSLVERFNQQTLPHALLFSGPEGLGANDLARAFTQLLLCQSPIDDIACHRCRSCQLQMSGSHPDILMILPDAKGKQIKIDQVRAAIKLMANTAQQGGKKIVVISPVEALNHNASNALLKSLEEPAGDTTLILITEQESLVLPTIKSRCSRYVLHPPSFDQAKLWLQGEGLAEHSHLLAHADGAPLKVRNWINEGYHTLREQIFDVLGDIGLRTIGPVQAATKLNMSPLLLLDPILNLLESQITLRLSPESIRSAQLRLASDNMQSIDRALGVVSIPVLMRYHDRLIDQKKQLQANVNLNVGLFIEQILMDWSAVCRQRSR